MKNLNRILLLSLAGIAAPSLIHGTEVPVAPGGLARAVATAAPGDKLRLAAGIYTERVVVDKPLTITAAGEEVVLEGAVPYSGVWRPVGEEMPGVWVAPLQKRAHGLLLEGKFVAEMRLSAAQAKGDWHWRTLLLRGTPLSGFQEIRALWMYHPEEKRIYARFPDGAGPAVLKMALVEAPEPLLTVAAANVVVEGLVFRGSAVAVALVGGATDCHVRRCRVESYESVGILLTKGAAGCIVEECAITRGAVEEWTPSLQHSRANYEIWRIHKDVGNKDRPGIEIIRAGAGNRILRNRIDRVFDGICLGDYKAESLSTPPADPEHGRGTEIAFNIIENTRDSGIELGVGCVDVHVHHNLLRRTHGGLRFKVPRVGPVFIHHNRLIDGAPFNIWFSMDSSPAEGFVYHNTIVRGDSAGVVISLKGSKSDFSAPRWHFLNNLVISGQGFFDQYGDQPPVDFTAGHNVTIGERRPWPKDPKRDPGSLYQAIIPHDGDGKPASGTAPINAGMDLSTYRNGKPLPGCEPGYFRGAAPDVGADEVE
jgi:hypothetical protein